MATDVLLKSSQWQTEDIFDCKDDDFCSYEEDTDVYLPNSFKIVKRPVKRDLSAVVWEAKPRSSKPEFTIIRNNYMFVWHAQARAYAKLLDVERQQDYVSEIIRSSRSQSKDSNLKNYVYLVMDSLANFGGYVFGGLSVFFLIKILSLLTEKPAAYAMPSFSAFISCGFLFLFSLVLSHVKSRK